MYEGGDIFMKLFECIPVISNEYIILQQISLKDADAVYKLMHEEDVYKYLPTFLLEKQYEDPKQVIRFMYSDAFNTKKSLFLGIYDAQTLEFTGLAELYEYNEKLHIIHMGYRLLKEFWGRGFASQTVKLLVEYLYETTDIEIICASTLPGNVGSEKVLKKNGFDLVVEDSDEDWGFGGMTPTTKWIR